MLMLLLLLLLLLLAADISCQANRFFEFTPAAFVARQAIEKLRVQTTFSSLYKT